MADVSAAADLPYDTKADAGAQVRLAFAEIRKLRFRQAKAKSAREARANEAASEFQKEIAETLAEVSVKPGRPESWHAMIDLDGRLREISHVLTDSQRLALRQEIDKGFQEIKAARAAFAVPH